LRVVDFSETSCVVTLFSDEFGKLGALAKGGRRPKGPFESALDVLALCRIVFIHKSSETLHLLTEARLERRFRAATRNLSCLYAGYYVAELLDGLTDTGDPHPELFTSANETLKRLDQQEAVGPLVLRFEMTALGLLGHLPSLDQCVGCAARLDREPTVAFGLLAGGVLCTDCRPGQRQVVRVGRQTIETLKRFADQQSEGWRDVEEKVVGGGELRGVINQYISHLLGRRPRLHAFLGSLGR
jgi:DNA repair protein RecO (recombination protein O)